MKSEQHSDLEMLHQARFSDTRKGSGSGLGKTYLVVSTCTRLSKCQSDEKGINLKSCRCNLWINIFNTTRFGHLIDVINYLSLIISEA